MGANDGQSTVRPLREARGGSDRGSDPEALLCTMRELHRLAAGCVGALQHWAEIQVRIDGTPQGSANPELITQRLLKVCEASTALDDMAEALALEIRPETVRELVRAEGLGRAARQLRRERRASEVRLAIGQKVFGALLELSSQVDALEGQAKPLPAALLSANRQAHRVMSEVIRIRSLWFLEVPIQSKGEAQE